MRTRLLNICSFLQNQYFSINRAGMTSEACCAAGKPVPSDYSCKGTVSKIGDLSIYEVGSGPRGIIYAYDIFGFEIPNARRVCDHFGENGFKVIMPDYYRGKPWSMEKFPPKDFTVLFNWAMKILKENVPDDNKVVMDYLKSSGCTSLSVLGFCWGGKVAITACASGEFSAAASAHPAFLTPEDAQALKCPMLFCPTGDDPPIDPVKEVIDKRDDIGSSCEFHRYEDQTHGFTSARGDWEKPEVKSGVDDFLKRAKDFLNKHM